MPTDAPLPLWHKGTRAEDWVLRFTVGEDWRWDTLLLPYDMEGTRAHAWGLAQIGVLTEDEFAALDEALDDLRTQYDEEGIDVRPEDEDMHTLLERMLTKRLGDVGKKVHAGRSRNDQVLAALRLYLKDVLADLARRAAETAEVLCGLAERYDHALMPGYTHLQPAMPTTAGLWAAGYAELLVSDLDALLDARRQVDASPLGSAAGYGIPHLDLPREAVAERLGFARVQTHVPAVQLARGKQELHVAHAAVQLGGTINRLASDLVLFNTNEFGFVELPEALTTGSSIMPQKRNPDVLELARATYHRLTSELHLLMTLPANLPGGYHRDLQLTKEAVMRCVLLSQDLVSATTATLQGLHFDREAMQAACPPALLATADALRRVREGIPFRDAYRQAADALDTLPAPTPEHLEAYATAGTPGNARPDWVREAIAERLQSLE